MKIILIQDRKGASTNPFSLASYRYDENTTEARQKHEEQQVFATAVRTNS
jgi:hypothetical protein